MILCGPREGRRHPKKGQIQPKPMLPPPFPLNPKAAPPPLSCSPSRLLSPPFTWLPLCHLLFPPPAQGAAPSSAWRSSSSPSARPASRGVAARCRRPWRQQRRTRRLRRQRSSSSSGGRQRSRRGGRWSGGSDSSRSCSRSFAAHPPAPSSSPSSASTTPPLHADGNRAVAGGGLLAAPLVDPSRRGPCLDVPTRAPGAPHGRHLPLRGQRAAARDPRSRDRVQGAQGVTPRVGVKSRGELPVRFLQVRPCQFCSVLQ